MDSGGDLGQHLLEKFSRRFWIRSGQVLCCQHTSLDEMRVFEGRPQDTAGNLSRPRAWITMNSSATPPTLHVALSGTKGDGHGLSLSQRSKVNRGC